MKGPYRADHVGSLLRPPELKAARIRRDIGEISSGELTRLEDQAIRDVVAFQESIGLKSITDGEFRRAMWHTDFLTGFDGIVQTKSSYSMSFQGKGGETAETNSMLAVVGKVRRSRPIMVDHFRFLHAATSRTAKLCIPSPTYLHLRGGRKLVDKAAYSDVGQFWDDIGVAYRAEIAELAQAGCRYLQLDDVSFSCLCDEKICEQVRADGEDPATLPDLYVRIINSLLSDLPSDMAVTLHTCRGNHQSMWMASGGYDAIAENLFTNADVDGFFLEYDTERAGGFEPLRFVPKGKKVVLGLVSSKEPALESSDDLKRRIDMASKFVPIEQICLSPQCGFASTSDGNRITEDVERRKLELVVKTAAEIWGAEG